MSTEAANVVLSAENVKALYDRVRLRLDETPDAANCPNIRLDNHGFYFNKQRLEDAREEVVAFLEATNPLLHCSRGGGAWLEKLRWRTDSSVCWAPRGADFYMFALLAMAIVLGEARFLRKIDEAEAKEDDLVVFEV